jgi:hypothetical protein
MQAVRAKLRLVAVTHTELNSKTLKFTTQYDDTIPEDRRFMQATPWGSFEMNVDNPSALAFFDGKIGQCFYMDVTPAAD